MEAHDRLGCDGIAARVGQYGFQFQVFASPHDVSDVRICDAPLGVIIAVVLVFEIAATTMKGPGFSNGLFKLKLLQPK